MDWISIHAWAEEVSIWTTLVINAAIIVGGIPAIIAFARQLSFYQTMRIALIGALIGAIPIVLLAVWVNAHGRLQMLASLREQDRTEYTSELRYLAIRKNDLEWQLLKCRSGSAAK